MSSLFYLYRRTLKLWILNLSFILVSCSHPLSLRPWDVKNIIPTDAEIVADLGNGWIVFELTPDDGDANCFMFHRLSNNGLGYLNGYSGLTQLQDCSKYWNYSGY